MSRNKTHNSDPVTGLTRRSAVVLAGATALAAGGLIAIAKNSYPDGPTEQQQTVNRTYDINKAHEIVINEARQSGNQLPQHGPADVPESYSDK